MKNQNFLTWLWDNFKNAKTTRIILLAGLMFPAIFWADYYFSGAAEPIKSLWPAILATHAIPVINLCIYYYLYRKYVKF